MPQIFRAADFVRELDKEDLRILTGIELGMRRFQFVPVEQISFYARINRSETQFRLDKIHRSGILQRSSQLGYIGYQLISESYDVLALHALVEKNIVVAVGDAIGRGKESDVFYGKTPEGTDVALKIHRIGQTSFRKVRKLRNYVKNRRHISWLYVSRLSAESEYEALKRIEPLNLNVPKALGHNRHIVVMELIDGNDLSLIPPLSDPMDVLNQILRMVEELFMKAHLIHCDLGEFNIVMAAEEIAQLIDFPQWEESTHPNALSYLARDLQNIQNFFLKNYEVTFDVDEFLDRMFGSERSQLEKY